MADAIGPRTLVARGHLQHAVDGTPIGKEGKHMADNLTTEPELGGRRLAGDGDTVAVADSSGDHPAIAGSIGDVTAVRQPSGWRRAWSLPKLLYGAVLVAAAIGLANTESATGRPLRVVPPTPDRPQVAIDQVAIDQVNEGSAAVFRRTLLPALPQAPSVHAATVTQLPDGDLLAAWFGGSREGAKDVCLYAATWDCQRDQWGTIKRLISADESSRELGRYVKKLGNPVLHCDRRGRVWLFYVTVSMGGWSGSSISVKYSDDQGYSWSESERLITSPFLNLSTLVRNPPLELDDGGLLLPVYHEFLTKYGEILHLSGDGELLDKYRMGSGESMQAALVAASGDDLLAFHRSRGYPAARVLTNRSRDGGQTWTDPRPMELANPNASVAVARGDSGRYVMALNASETERRELSLAVSNDGESWRVVRTLAVHEGGGESSYPTLIAGDCGGYHLVYTWGREQICHTYFNETWLEPAP